MAEEGYIAISRKMFSHPIWAEKREFSKAEAWIDLIQTASWGNDNQMIFDGKVVKWQRGQLAASVRFLKERWGWASNGKITRFLKMLSDECMIDINTEHQLSIITLCKYDRYNNQREPNGTATEQQRNSNGTQTEQNKITSSKGNKINKLIELPFKSDLFKAEWDRWKQYKKLEHRFTYKSEMSESAALEGLFTMSKGIEEKAIGIIKHTIANSWKGFVAPKEDQGLFQQSTSQPVAIFQDRYKR